MNKSLIMTIAFSILAIFIIGCSSESMCYVTTGTSPEAPDHTHRWCTGQEMTEQYCAGEACHKHKLNEKANLAEADGLGPHTHTLG